MLLNIPANQPSLKSHLKWGWLYRYQRPNVHQYPNTYPSEWFPSKLLYTLKFSHLLTGASTGLHSTCPNHISLLLSIYLQSAVTPSLLAGALISNSIQSWMVIHPLKHSHFSHIHSLNSRRLNCRTFTHTIL